MGYTAGMNRKEILEEIRSPERFRSTSGENQLIESRLIGNHHWFLLKDSKSNELAICLDLISSDGSGTYGYRTMDERCHPYYYDCPMSLIQKASPTNNENTNNWRNRAIELHEAAKEKAFDPEPNMVIEVGVNKKTRYTLIQALAPRKGWQVQGVVDGIYYRMPVKQLKGATVISLPNGVEVKPPKKIKDSCMSL